VEETATAIEDKSGSAAMILSIHSFTPRMGNRPRPWHVGLLWDLDDRLFRKLEAGLKTDPSLIVGDNEPYDGALKGDTLHEHATITGRAHVLIEIRQDLIGSETGQKQWAERLAPLFLSINSDPAMHEWKQFGSRTD
jgi:predicted N-formylglutamate amidohydrolase